MNLENKVALITGAARGIGKAIAEELLKAKANVIITDINEETCIETQKYFEAKGYNCDYAVFNVADYEETEKAFKKIIEKHKGLDILVNNAGITKDKLFMRMKVEDWQTVIDVNLTGVFNCCKAAYKPMLKKRAGRIINISSVVGLMGNAGQVNYSASKAGLLGLTKSLAKEFGSRGITVNAIAPGFIQTEMTHVLSEDVIKNFMDIIPLKRAGNPEDVAKAVLFLASDFAGYITGQVINVDGGMVMQ